MMLIVSHGRASYVGPQRGTCESWKSAGSRKAFFVHVLLPCVYFEYKQQWKVTCNVATKFCSFQAVQMLELKNQVDWSTAEFNSEVCCHIHILPYILATECIQTFIHSFCIQNSCHGFTLLFMITNTDLFRSGWSRRRSSKNEQRPAGCNSRSMTCPTRSRLASLCPPFPTVSC